MEVGGSSGVDGVTRVVLSAAVGSGVKMMMMATVGGCYGDGSRGGCGAKVEMWWRGSGWSWCGGYVFAIGNLVLSWKGTLQPSIALPTTGAEYLALTEAAKEGIWLKGLIEDLGFPQHQTTVFCDSMGAICLAKDQVYHDRTKHIDVRYHFIRIERRIKVKKISTEDNPADVFNKPVHLSKFRHCLDMLNINNWKYGVT
nr:retrovirus-related Pol polyprotein from transposon TNT 1-94 [Tanacetum cinerariifolium]